MEYCKLFIGAHHYCFKFMFLVILKQNNFYLFSDDEGGAITCHSHEISQ